METHAQYDDPRDDDDQCPEPRERPPTPEEAFDLLFESWQDAEEDAHMQQVLAALDAQGRAHNTPAKLAP